MTGAVTVGDDLTLLDEFAGLDQRLLIDAGVLVGALELVEQIDVDAGLAGEALAVAGVGDADDDALGIHAVDDPGPRADHHGAGVAGGDGFHAGAHDGRLGHEQRHRLALHVGTHQGAVGVVVLQERDQGGGHADQLFGRDVDEVDVLAGGEDEVAPLAGIHVVVDDVALLFQPDGGLGDDVLLLLPGGHVEGVDLVQADFLLPLAQPLVFSVRLLLQDDLGDLER